MQENTNIVEKSRQKKVEKEISAASFLRLVPELVWSTASQSLALGQFLSLV